MGTQKTLLQINTVANYGSTGRIAEEIGMMATNKGWQSYIAYGRYGRSSQSELVHINSFGGLHVHFLQTRLFDKHGLGSQKATSKFVAEVEKMKPDLVHLHNLHGYYLNFEVLFNYLSDKNIPVVWTLHDCWPFTGHCVYFSYIGCNRWMTGCYNCPQTTSYPASWFADRSKSNYFNKRDSFLKLKNLTLIAVSNWMSELLRSSFLGNLPAKVIHNGINTSFFLPRITDELKMRINHNDKFIILGVANNWIPRKGINDFVKLAELIGEDDQIVLIGLSPMRTHTLPENIIAASRTEDMNELVNYYNLADVFINPTWEDNFPTTNLESLACGTPVITYKTGGSPEAVDENTGFVVDQGDICGLLSAIKKVKSLGKKHFSTACRERALKLYDKDDRYNEYLLLYESLLENRMEAEDGLK